MEKEKVAMILIEEDVTGVKNKIDAEKINETYEKLYQSKIKEICKVSDLNECDYSANYIKGFQNSKDFESLEYYPVKILILKTNEKNFTEKEQQIFYKLL